MNAHVFLYVLMQTHSQESEIKVCRFVENFGDNSANKGLCKKHMDLPAKRKRRKGSKSDMVNKFFLQTTPNGIEFVQVSVVEVMVVVPLRMLVRRLAVKYGNGKFNIDKIHTKIKSIDIQIMKRKPLFV